MNAFADFVAWAGTQKAAGDLIGLSPPMVSLILKGERSLQPEHAIAAERASGRVYRADDMCPAIQFLRDADGEITSYCIHVDAQPDENGGPSKVGA